MTLKTSPNTPPDSDRSVGLREIRTRPPEGAVTSTLMHRVGFYETDAMGIVHHANYLHFFENARVVWLETHDQPYPRYVDEDIHFAVTQANVRYHRSARFDDRLEVTVWLDWVRGASLRMAYCIHCDGELIASGYTEHAAVGGDGRLRRIPKQHRARLARGSVELLG